MVVILKKNYESWKQKYADLDPKEWIGSGFDSVGKNLYITNGCDYPAGDRSATLIHFIHFI